MEVQILDNSKNLLWFYSFCSIFFLHLCSQSTTATQSGNDTDRLALLSLKEKITQDSLQALSSWNDSLHFCLWNGVSCGSQHERVTSLNLSFLSLVGTLSPNVANLSFLRTLDLESNSFQGQIPQEIGYLFRLRRLNLHSNSFEGEIPASLSNCTYLTLLNLSSNNLVGNIPVQLGSLSKLQILNLYINGLTGSIPTSFGNMSSLFRLSLRRNNLDGSIPSDLGQATNLGFLQLAENRLSGTIPSSIYNLSNIFMLSLAMNQLYGRISPELGLSFPKLELFYVSRNLFIGSIPVSLSNASLLEELYFPNNNFTGGVPMDLGRLQYLRIFNIGGNRMGTGKVGELNFVDSIVNCSNLQQFGFHNNSFGGPFPRSIANFSTQLYGLEVGENRLYGRIPKGIENLINLTTLYMNNNLLSGSVPEDIGKLQQLRELGLSGNRFSGLIPSSIGNMSELIELYLQENFLNGTIPPSLGNCQRLTLLNLSQNNLSGTIPKQIISISSLSISLNLAQNSLTGSLPSEVGNLKNLEELDISENKLTGEIPTTLGDCVTLVRIYMQNNFLSGTIPLSLSSLRGIEVLDLSQNNLTGQIPEFLGNFSLLQNLNLSHNDFEGELPKDGVFTNVSAVSVLGNDKLCGVIQNQQLRSCPTQINKSSNFFSSKVFILVISIAIPLILLSCVFATVCWMQKLRKKRSTTSSMEDLYTNISYAELRRATDEFSSSNLIGAGSYGSVYKGIFACNNTLIAVKVLNLHQQGASKSFIAECDALRNVRHRNLVKVLASCSSVDFQGNGFKALVFEFMPNGNLDEWLHPKEDGDHKLKNLSFFQRLNIAIDVASALDYLHHYSGTPIAHCDLKPTNVLLDDDMVAHVSDFGLAKILSGTINNSSQNDFSSIAIKGSIGYVAPEYGMGSDVSTLGDVYSYGILLLELFSGRRPTENMFENGLSLHEFAKNAYTDRVFKIVDPRLLEEKDEGQRIVDCFASVVRIGVACSVESPKERMEMKDAAKEMHMLKDRYYGSEIYK